MISLRLLGERLLGTGRALLRQTSDFPQAIELRSLRSMPIFDEDYRDGVSSDEEHVHSPVLSNVLLTPEYSKPNEPEDVMTLFSIFMEAERDELIQEDDEELLNHLYYAGDEFNLDIVYPRQPSYALISEEQPVHVSTQDFLSKMKSVIKFRVIQLSLICT